MSIHINGIQLRNEAFQPNYAPFTSRAHLGGHGGGIPKNSKKKRKAYTLTKPRELWTDDEHLKFVKAVKLYKRDWNKIREHIETKTVIQVRSHAQKYFSKLEKMGRLDLIPAKRSRKTKLNKVKRKQTTRSNKRSAGLTEDVSPYSMLLNIYNNPLIAFEQSLMYQFYEQMNQIPQSFLPPTALPPYYTHSSTTTGGHIAGPRFGSDGSSVAPIPGASTATTAAPTRHYSPECASMNISIDIHPIHSQQNPPNSNPHIYSQQQQQPQNLSKDPAISHPNAYYPQNEMDFPNSVPPYATNHQPLDDFLQYQLPGQDAVSAQSVIKSDVSRSAVHVHAASHPHVPLPSISVHVPTFSAHSVPTTCTPSIVTIPTQPVAVPSFRALPVHAPTLPAPPGTSSSICGQPALNITGISGTAGSVPPPPHLLPQNQSTSLSQGCLSDTFAPPSNCGSLKHVPSLPGPCHHQQQRCPVDESHSFHMTPSVRTSVDIERQEDAAKYFEPNKMLK